MPHGNGRIYKDSSTTPPGGISIADIQAVIVSGKNDIKSLALSSKINPDALFKPYEGDGGPENPNFATGGPDGMYGYSIPNTTGHLMDVYNKLWTFNPPVSFGRFDDFDCYNHVPRFSSNPWGLSVTETPSFVATGPWSSSKCRSVSRSFSIFSRAARSSSSDGSTIIFPFVPSMIAVAPSGSFAASL